MTAPATPMRWVACTACGAPLCLFLDGTRRVGHSKPEAAIGVPNTVPCRYYRDSSAEKLWADHENATPIEQAVSCVPIWCCSKCGRRARPNETTAIEAFAKSKGAPRGYVEWMCPACANIS